MMASSSHHIYVIELDPQVWRDKKKFRDANPHYRHRLECLYVGITARLPQERIIQHLHGGKSKKGINLSSSLVRKYGLYLRPTLYQHLNPLTRKRAVLLEKSLAESLRLRGYAVWWN